MIHNISIVIRIGTCHVERDFILYEEIDHMQSFQWNVDKTGSYRKIVLFTLGTVHCRGGFE